MTKRERIHSKIEQKKSSIKKLMDEITELQKEDFLLTDKVQQFTEEMVTLGRGKNKREVLVGRIHWKETFIDEDTGEPIVVQRSQVVCKNGEWI